MCQKYWKQSVQRFHHNFICNKTELTAVYQQYKPNIKIHIVHIDTRFYTDHLVEIVNELEFRTYDMQTCHLPQSKSFNFIQKINLLSNFKRMEYGDFFSKAFFL